MKGRRNQLGRASTAKARETVDKLGANSAKHSELTGKMGRMEEKI